MINVCHVTAWEGHGQWQNYKKIMAFLLDARLQDGRVVYVAEVLVVIQYNVLVARHGYTRIVVV